LNNCLKDIFYAQNYKKYRFAYLYFRMSYYFGRIGFKIFSDWAKVQAKKFVVYETDSAL
jgi:ferritin